MAWKERLHALAVLSSSVGLHTLLWEAGAAAGEEVDPKVALVLQNEGVRVAETLGNLQILTEALLRRSRVETSIGSVDAAVADLHQAEVGLVRSPPGDVKNSLIGDIAFSRGEIERERNPNLAITFYNDAITSYEKKKRLLNLAVAYTSRARAGLSAGLEVEAAADLDAAIQIFEQQRAAVSDLNLRLSYSEAVQALFDERILLEVRRGQPERALENVGNPTLLAHELGHVFGLAHEAGDIMQPSGSPHMPSPANVSLQLCHRITLAKLKTGASACISAP
jgi:hypothetical protein